MSSKTASYGLILIILGSTGLSVFRFGGGKVVGHAKKSALEASKKEVNDDPLAPFSGEQDYKAASSRIDANYLANGGEEINRIHWLLKILTISYCLFVIAFASKTKMWFASWIPIAISLAMIVWSLMHNGRNLDFSETYYGWIILPILIAMYCWQLIYPESRPEKKKSSSKPDPDMRNCFGFV